MKIIANSFYKNLALVAYAFAVGCSNPAFKQIGSQVLTSTGAVSSSQADTLFAAGGKLAKAVTPLSEEEEYYLGRGVAAAILSQYKVDNDRTMTSYLNKVAGVVAANSGRPETFGGYHVAILDTREVNAVSAPGGFIFVSRGLLSLVKNEDQVAAILAHEVGHIALGHGVSAISESNLTDAVTLLGKQGAESYGGATVSQLTSVFGDSIKDVTNTLLKKGYSRSQEYKADEYAVAVLKKAGYKPAALVEALHNIEAKDGDARGGWHDTHPSPSRRISNIEDLVGSSAPTPGEEVRAKRFMASASKVF